MARVMYLEGYQRRFRKRRSLALRRLVRNEVNPFSIPDVEFIEHFRMRKPDVRRLVDELAPFIGEGHHPRGIPSFMKILVSLNFFAHGSYQRQVGDSWLHCMGRSTAGLCIREVTEALNEPAIQRRWLKFPRTRQDRDAIMEKNELNLKVPGVVGYIDGTEIAIVTPYKEHDGNPQAFWSRKGQYSLNCQIICDSELRIMNIVASYPGSCNDAYIYNGSAARDRMEAAFRESPCWLLGDSGYPLEPWLMTPILDAEPNSPEEVFTRFHCSARNCVERCIGVLKARFRCLHRSRVLHYDPLMTGKIVKACCVLHNFCLEARLPQPQDMEEDNPVIPLDQDDHDEELQMDADQGNRRNVALRVRQRLVDFLSMRVNQLV